MSDKATFKLHKDDLATIKTLSGLMDETGLSELTIEQDDAKLTLKRPSGEVVTVAAPTPAPATVSATVSESTTPAAAPKNIFKAPLVGTFYRASGPDAAPFVQVGDAVKAGQVIGIIEAMKTMNQIEADRDGVVSAVLVENAQPVEFGQPLIQFS